MIENLINFWFLPLYRKHKYDHQNIMRQLRLCVSKVAWFFVWEEEQYLFVYTDA